MDEVSHVSAEPLVSVVIPAFNAEKTLERAMATILQEKSVPLELIVVDDGSTDSTPQLIDAAAARDNRVHRISRPNGHVAAACNTGIRAARGKYVAFLEADDEWLPGKLRQQIEVMESHAEVGLMFCNFFNQDEVTKVRQLYSDQDKELLNSLPRRRIGFQNSVIDVDVRPYLIKKCFILASSVVVRREVLLKQTGFDEALKGAQDWDLWFRLGGETLFAYTELPLAIRFKRSDSMSRPSPNWYRAVIKAQEKVLALMEETAALREYSPLLKSNLRGSHRLLVLSHVKRWEWVQAWKMFCRGMRYGFDPLGLLILALGVFGPVPFQVRRSVLGAIAKVTSSRAV